MNYRKVFLLDPLPLVRDYARTEGADAQHEIHRLLREVYGSLAFPLVQVPLLPPEQRADLVLAESLEI